MDQITESRCRISVTKRSSLAAYWEESTTVPTEHLALLFTLILFGYRPLSRDVIT